PSLRRRRGSSPKPTTSLLERGGTPSLVHPGVRHRLLLRSTAQLTNGPVRRRPSSRGALYAACPRLRRGEMSIRLIAQAGPRVLMLFFAPLAFAQTTITMGETAILPTDNGGDGNLLVAYSVTLAEGAILQSLSFYVTTPGGQLRLGVYDASGPGGGPG